MPAWEQEGSQDRSEVGPRENAIARTTARMVEAWIKGEFRQARYFGDVLDHLEDLSDSEFMGSR